MDGQLLVARHRRGNAHLHLRALGGDGGAAQVHGVAHLEGVRHDHFLHRAEKPRILRHGLLPGSLYLINHQVILFLQGLAEAFADPLDVAAAENSGVERRPEANARKDQRRQQNDGKQLSNEFFHGFHLSQAGGIHLPISIKSRTSSCTSTYSVVSAPTSIR